MNQLFSGNGPLGFLDDVIKSGDDYSLQMQAAQSRPKIILGPGVLESDDFSKWPVIYPHYIDQKLTVREGRRIDVEICEPYPEVERIAMVLKDLGYRYVIEDKCYPRNYLLRGRIRVDFKSANIRRKNDLLTDICHMLPTLPPKPVEEEIVPEPPKQEEKKTQPKKPQSTNKKKGPKRR